MFYERSSRRWYIRYERNNNFMMDIREFSGRNILFTVVFTIIRWMFGEGRNEN